MMKNLIISYAASFASFLLSMPVAHKINKIILFGSVARGDATSESDIDIFVDANHNLESDVYKVLELFKQTQQYSAWQLKGLKNEISLKVGILDEWSLRRQVISSGIILYGKYTELPKNAKPYCIITAEGLSEKRMSEQMTIFRKLYGYTQKVGNKIYNTEGLITKSNGKKLGRGVFVLPMEGREETLAFLRENKVKFKIYETWTDSFS